MTLTSFIQYQIALISFGSRFARVQSVITKMIKFVSTKILYNYKKGFCFSPSREVAKKPLRPDL